MASETKDSDNLFSYPVRLHEPMTELGCELIQCEMIGKQIPSTITAETLRRQRLVNATQMTRAQVQG